MAKRVVFLLLIFNTLIWSENNSALAQPSPCGVPCPGCDLVCIQFGCDSQECIDCFNSGKCDNDIPINSQLLFLLISSITYGVWAFRGKFRNLDSCDNKS